MNHYERLGVTPFVGAAELRRAYRQRAATSHPDTNPDDVEAATREMALINDAYETLSDPVRRLHYDRTLRKAIRSNASPTTASAPAGGSVADADDDPVRRARREAKERQAAEARRRGYRDPGGGFFEWLRSR